MTDNLNGQNPQNNQPEQNNQNTGNNSMLNDILNTNTQETISININEFDDIVKMVVNNNYEGCEFIQQNDTVRIVFKKGGNIVDQKIISYPLYLNIFLKIKNITKMGEDNNEYACQYIFAGKMYNIYAKRENEVLGEKLILRIKKANQATTSYKDIIIFLLGIIFLGSIVIGTLVIYTIINANNYNDVVFLESIGINVNEVNGFVRRLTIGISSAFIILEIIGVFFFGIKAIFTKKSQKIKKVFFTIMTILMLIFIACTLALGANAVSKIDQLPSWQDLRYGIIPVRDANKIGIEGVDPLLNLNTSDGRSKKIYGPIKLEYDLNVYFKNKSKEGLSIERYGFRIELNKSEIVNEKNKLPSVDQKVEYYFKKKGDYEVFLDLEYRKKTGNKETVTESMKLNSFIISEIVEISEENVKGGGKSVRLDATSLKNDGKINWFKIEESSTGEVLYYAGTTNILLPTETIYGDVKFGMYVGNLPENDKIIPINSLNNIFVIEGIEKFNACGEIVYEKNIFNDLSYTFYFQPFTGSINGIECDIENGNIDHYVWTIGNTVSNSIINRRGKESEVSKYDINFSTYKTYEIILTITDTLGRNTEIVKYVDVAKTSYIITPTSIKNEGEKLKFTHENGTYVIQDLRIPTTLEFDARDVKTNIANDSLDRETVNWKVFLKKGDKYEQLGNTHTGMLFDYKFETIGDYKIEVSYDFKNLVTSIETNIVETIIINTVKKDVILDLQISPAEETYVPVTVQFDASNSEVNGENITKFIYNYGDGIEEERDAFNPGHYYEKAGSYDIKLTVETSKGNKYSMTKKLILKEKNQKININASSLRSRVGQPIDFDCLGSVGTYESFEWDFGDQKSSNESSPSHAYNKPGLYTVTVVGKTDNNNILTETITVEIVE